MKMMKVHRKRKSYRPGDPIKGFYGTQYVPQYLFRGANDIAQLKEMYPYPFMVATSFDAAAEYGRWVAVYAFLGGTVDFGFSAVLQRFQEGDFWHHEVSKAAPEYGVDLLLSAGHEMSEENEHAVIVDTTKLRLVEVLDKRVKKNYTKYVNREDAQ